MKENASKPLSEDCFGNPEEKRQQIERIEKYEAMLDAVRTFLAQDNPSQDECARIAETVSALEAYYTSLAWRQDYHDEENGLFPSDLKRGVLSEDGIYNVLEAWQDLMQEQQPDDGGSCPV